MGRKPKIPTDDAPALSSNPFAALQGALGDLPEGSPQPARPEPKPAEHSGSPAKLDGKIVVRRERKGRGGKTATIIEGLRVSASAREQLAQDLRRSLGCGAHVEGSNIVLTGAQTERVRDWLKGRGATRVVLGN